MCSSSLEPVTSVRHYHRSNVDCCFTDRIAAIARTTRKLSLESVVILSGPAAAATFVSILYSSAFHRYYPRQGYLSAFVLCLIVNGLRGKTAQPIFTKFGGKVAHGPLKKSLDLSGNPDQVTSGLS